ncbi:calcium-binding protein [Saccharibacillus qingshengii]|uniref:calcium-binding protein n=1 Tax=Saccharibacillus qingshengii TaxID=1763540 RepID=UPI001551993E|nr:calcium-binding protein [Saccharibacillus qingshengii]
MALSKKVKTFKALLSDWNGTVRGRPYRKIAIQQNATLSDLAEAILTSFDFDMDHMYGFYDNIKNWTRASEGYELFADMGQEDLFPGVRKKKITQVFREPKQKFLLLFDYGDEWRFIVEFLGDEEPAPGMEIPYIFQSVGEAPDQYEEDNEDELWDEEEDLDDLDDELQDDPVAESPLDAKREKRIHSEIIVDAYDPEERAISWYTYLQDTMNFPFNALCTHPDAQSPLLIHEKVRVLGLADAEDCTERIRVRIEWEKREFTVPLEQLNPVRTNKPTRQAIEDWVYWQQQKYIF